ncbi:MAG: carnitine 3-dehydrogenase [Acetobacteraceae bacterium]|nr:carnitine 3-dehydrogenase [Acetobacteraceae bacterium]
MTPVSGPAGPATTLPGRVALVGSGVIGAGWAARFLLNGIDVAVYDPDPELARKLEAVLANARRAWGRLFPRTPVREGRLEIAPSIAVAVRETGFVQESLPEREDLKRRELAEIERHAPAEAIIASSTSGLLPSRLQAGMAHPDRFVVGHPFNPVYLLPLVEVCGGDATDAVTSQRAASLYRALGMHPLLVGKEIDGFIADRLLEALWREALWLVRDGVATTEEIDDAICYGAGLRWSFMGTFLIYRLAGGEAGMRHFLAQFGPTLKLPWTRLEAPELTEVLIDRIAAQSDAQARGVSVRELERRRDDCLVAVLDALRTQNYAAGAVLATPAHAAADIKATPLSLHAAEVAPDWIDYNGHMTEHRYLQVFSDAAAALLHHAGMDACYLEETGSFFTVETHLRHLAEARQGTGLHVTTQLLDFDGKRLHLFHRLVRDIDATLLATAEQMLLHVDAASRRTAEASGALAARLRALAAEQAKLAWPDAAGQLVGGRPKM